MLVAGVETIELSDDLVAAGYRQVIREREPDWWDHAVLKGPDTNVNLHVFSAGCAELERMVGFRDWLRTHDDDRQLYEAAWLVSSSNSEPMKGLDPLGIAFTVR